MYYIWSLVCTLAIFVFLQYSEYKKNMDNNIRYNLITPNNIVTFIILYIIVSIIFYFSFNYDIKYIINKKNGGFDKEINHITLGKISEDLSIGFTPS